MREGAEWEDEEGAREDEGEDCWGRVDKGEDEWDIHCSMSTVEDEGVCVDVCF